MGLDDFMDVDSQESSSSKSKSSRSKKKDKDKFPDDDGSVGLGALGHDTLRRLEDGNITSNGLLGFKTMEEYNETKATDEDGEDVTIPIHRMHYKFVLPIFPRIDRRNRWERGKRYRFWPEDKDILGTGAPKPNGWHVAFVAQDLQLKKINREIVMLDTGELDPHNAMSVLEERLGEKVKPDTEVTLYMFTDSIKMSCLANHEANDRDFDFLDKEANVQLFRHRSELDEEHGADLWKGLEEWK